MYKITDEFLTKEFILSYLSEKDIFELVFENVSDSFVISPFRIDNNPGCFFSQNSKGELKFIDFGNSSEKDGIKMKSISCFDAVRLYYNLSSYYETLEFIYQNYIKNKNIVKRERNENFFNVPKKRETEIYVKTRNFTYLDKNYWNRFFISRKNLEEDLVFPVEKVFILNSRKGDVVFEPSTITYVYTEFNNNKKKVYSPYGKIFYTTCRKNDIGGVKHINYERESLIITKSYKDYRVLRNLDRNCIWFQSETSIPDKEHLLNILLKFKDNIILFDNDPPGIEASSTFLNIFYNLCNIREISLPIEKQVKDSAETVEKLGQLFLDNFLKQNKC